MTGGCKFIVPREAKVRNCTTCRWEPSKWETRQDFFFGPTKTGFCNQINQYVEKGGNRFMDLSGRAFDNCTAWEPKEYTDDAKL